MAVLSEECTAHSTQAELPSPENEYWWSEEAEHISILDEYLRETDFYVARVALACQTFLLGTLIWLLNQLKH